MESEQLLNHPILPYEVGELRTAFRRYGLDESPELLNPDNRKGLIQTIYG